MAIRFLCIFGAPRTGSSHLNKLLKGCPAFAAKGELFHRHGVGRHTPIEYERLREISNGVVTDSERFLTWRHKHPVKTLEALHSACDSKVVAFKLFPNHLSFEMIEAKLLPRKDIAFAILRRRPIESFISTIKAKNVGLYAKTDTTSLKPELSATGFLQWARKMRTWFAWVGDSLEGRDQPFARISFEKHLDGVPGELALANIRELLHPLGIADIGTPERVIEGTRQDKEPDYKHRVANWDVFEAKLREAPQSAKMLKWAERTF